MPALGRSSTALGTRIAPPSVTLSTAERSAWADCSCRRACSPVARARLTFQSPCKERGSRPLPRRHRWLCRRHHRHRCRHRRPRRLSQRHRRRSQRHHPTPALTALTRRQLSEGQWAACWLLVSAAALRPTVGTGLHQPGTRVCQPVVTLLLLPAWCSRGSRRVCVVAPSHSAAQHARRRQARQRAGRCRARLWRCWWAAWHATRHAVSQGGAGYLHPHEPTRRQLRSQHHRVGVGGAHHPRHAAEVRTCCLRVWVYGLVGM